MGNNHDKYFGKQKRKILVLGLPQSGKTALVETIVDGKQQSLKVQKTKDLNIRDAKIEGLSITFFDLAGSQRQRIFWKQHYQGTQGLIFLISTTAPPPQLQLSLSQLQKLSKHPSLLSIPMAICLHKSDIKKQQQIFLLQKTISQRIKSFEQYIKNIQIFRKTKIFFTSIKNGGKIRDMMGWLLKETKPV